MHSQGLDIYIFFLNFLRFVLLNPFIGYLPTKSRYIFKFLVKLFFFKLKILLKIIEK